MNPTILKVMGVLTGGHGGGPWRSKSVLAAVALVVVGLGVWFSDLKTNPLPSETTSRMTNAPGIAPPAATGEPAGSHWNWRRPVPFYVPAAASYAAGFCIGWFFRKVIRIIVALTALVVALLGVGKFAGCDVAPAQERVKRGGEWAQREVTAAKDYLQHFLPSAVTGGAGTFVGFRRRRKVAASGSAD